ncbi:MAG TPA: tetratricopeptide repeat protein [Anaerolineales bacterium]|nr:tetratricopeptide repeat protein [Anaerolineales bacterium]HRQ91723.1 tetratricopeptide repeat protein [Anaerolineales bacterium]
MPWRAIVFTVLALALGSLACNLQRVLDPSLPTSTPASAALPSPTPEPTAAPTPTNSARVQSADRLFFYGDWQAALTEYERVYQGTEIELHPAALLGMGRAYVKLGRTAEAISTLSNVIAEFPGSEEAAGAHFALAELYAAQGNGAAADAQYQNYLALRPSILDAYVHELRGDALQASGDLEGALAAFQQAMTAPRLGDTLSLQVKIGKVHSERGDHQAAILAYQAVYTTTANDYLKADMDLLMGRAYQAIGDSAQANALFTDAVTKFPLSFSSYAALVELVNAGIAVDELQRGLVDYYAATNSSGSTANELYLVAIAAFDRYLANAAEHTDTAHYFRALSLRSTGDFEAAVRELDGMLVEHALGTRWVDGYLLRADIQWRNQDNFDAAIAGLESFVVSNAGHPEAARILYRAGMIAEVGGFLTRAAEILPRVANEYPASEYAYDALFMAGISRYRLGEYVAAQSLFARGVEAALSLEQQAQSQFWIGKSQQAQGDSAAAETTWRTTTAIDPTGYYSERARDILDGLDPFAPPAGYHRQVDLDAERQQAEAWMRTTFSLGADIDLSQPGPLWQDARFVRGTELWHLGRYQLARNEFESLRADLTTDAANSYRLANHLVELGMYRSAVFAAREVLNLAGLSDAQTMNAPVYFNRIRFGFYFQDLVETDSARRSIDPLFVYSMMRQESLYEGFVTSSAGARGLLQIIPATGQEMATFSGWPENYSGEDLYRPNVSIRLGVEYLARQLNAFDGDIYAALAAYNAGPGNAVFWQGQANGDPDLFVEIVQFVETRNHIRSIYEIYDIYRNLYASE